MAYERAAGIQVTDEIGYQAYRDGMLPILARYGGVFRYDFRVSEVLKADTGQPINRVFLLRFPDLASREAFFADPEYQKVRERFLVSSVSSVTTLAEYEI